MSSQTHFAQVPRADIPRAKFKRDSNLHTTLNAGFLVPIFLEEVLPGDTHILKEHLFGRLATPLKPIMDNMYLDTQYFFVPNRLLWDNWKKFNGEQKNPGDSTDFLIPVIEKAAGSSLQNMTLADYFGIPTYVSNAFEFNVLPFRAYNLIYNEWYRDQNLQNSLVVHTDDGPDPITDYSLQRRGKRHDYFTGSLPFPQKGPAVTIPLGTTAPLKATGGIRWSATDNSFSNMSMSGVGGLIYGTPSPGSGNRELKYSGGMQVDLTSATAATINAIREAFQVQRLLERDARGGTRYTEIIRSHFGVISPDARLQRPEYLGGSSTRINVTPVANTTGTTTAAQGDLAGVGTVAKNGKGFTYSATEHGYIIGLASVRADLNYQQGLNRLWSRQTRFDFYWPALSHLGEQAVLNKEIYLQGTSSDDTVFGYQERYAEYRYKPNMITGKFRSNDPQSLDSWHLAQDFATTPVLNGTFIQENPPIDRVIAVPSEPHLILDCYFDLDSVRPMPMYSVPGMIDHF